ncbi:Zinc finger (MYND type) family protein / programmed cell death 2 C-terminal domain-containing protein, putative isoform 3 [Theobroma cacao]|uniref:Zinc finger (MYND type) family protein / programmed cell death 2 C-terminal domain-containing protein, putative isoform 3 n=1 Tax=Theobroma cacao TaxID=3641 RepID=A0A061F5J6_THECC|nr:Zinc finger (MYND type) family protein / programmed cell death 2 C-terminal domain-containing protein, putative isoform 3 [Theobroma cacao]
MDIDGKEDSIEELKGLRITPLDDDDDDDDEEIAVDDDEDDDEEEEEAVILGFVEKPQHSWSVLRQQFPSKAGGVPAWLDAYNLPSGMSCVCDICGQPLQFVLQVYAPLVEKDSTFHRTLFVFMCLSMKCLQRDQHEQWKRHPEKQSRSVKVFRCQLPRANTFYSNEPPKGNATDKPLTPGAPLCNWCGTWKGDKFCSSCKIARYCSQKHQAMHWHSGHKLECQQLRLSPQSSDCNACDGGITEIRAQKVANSPEQVLRYCRSASSKPLWPMSGGRPSKADIARCSYCGGLLCFEFQDEDHSLDWATIVVYTCEASCEGIGYKEEFAWVQLSPSTNFP